MNLLPWQAPFLPDEDSARYSEKGLLCKRDDVDFDSDGQPNF